MKPVHDRLPAILVAWLEHFARFVGLPTAAALVAIRVRTRRR